METHMLQLLAATKCSIGLCVGTYTSKAGGSLACPSH
jgi:hypothetical protein